MAKAANRNAAGLTRDTTLTQRVVDKVRAGIESGAMNVADVLLSERELAERYDVSRVTARRALRILVRDGYLVSLPRQGYRLVSGSSKAPSRELIALVRSDRGDLGMDDYTVRLWDACHRAAVEVGKDLWAAGIEDSQPSAFARHVASRGVTGAIVTGDDLELARALRRENVASVLVDAAHPDVESVTVDFFGGAYRLTENLIERGHRKLACLCYDPYGSKETVQVRERLGGFLAATACAGTSVPGDWILFSDGRSSIGEKLTALVRKKATPEAVVVLWPQLLDEVGAAISSSKANIDVTAWWGAARDARDYWISKFPMLPIPDGVSWDVMDLARKAMEQLKVVTADEDRAQGRTLVPVRFVEGGSTKLTASKRARKRRREG